MATLDEKVLELETRIEQLEMAIRRLVDREDGQAEPNASLSQTELLALLKAQGFVREPNLEERQLADAWETLPVTEQQGHIRHMQSLPMTSLLSQILIESRR